MKIIQARRSGDLGPRVAVMAALVVGLILLVVGPQGSASAARLSLLLLLVAVVCALWKSPISEIRAQTRQTCDRVLRIIQLSIVVLAISLLVIFVTSGRPTADEFLLGPIFHGFYVDQPTTPLFEPSDSSVVNYLNGAASIVRLGWDGWPNALIFQMGPSVLLNELGPSVSTIQGLVFAVIIWICCGVTISALSTGRSFLDPRIPILVLTLICAMSVGNFNTTRVPFGLYPFLGIRFGLYLIHALMIVGYLTWLLVREDQKDGRTTQVAVACLIVVVGLVSLWYAALLGVFLLCRLLWLGFTKRSIKRFSLLVVSLPIATIVFHAGLKGALGRTSADDGSMISVVGTFLDSVVFNSDSRLFSSELWSTIYGLPGAVGFLGGILCYVMTPRPRNWMQSHLKKVAITGLVASPFIPIIFVFQEFITYEAWWHRTTPITLSATIFFLTGCWVASVLSQSRKESDSLRHTAVSILCVLFLVFTVGEELRRSVNSIVQFRSEWDRGNIFGIGSPVENNADYNVRNVLRLVPYTPINWDVQGRIVAGIPTSVTFRGVSGVPVPTSNVVGEDIGEVVLETTASAFDHDIGGFLRYRLSLSLQDHTFLDVVVRDAQGTRTLETRDDGTILIEGLMSQPGRVEIKINHSGQRTAVPVNSYELMIGLSGAIRERFGLDESDLVLMS